MGELLFCFFKLEDLPFVPFKMKASCFLKANQ